MNPYLGEIRIVSFQFVPRGWALCNGTLLSISQNAALFSILGTTYGGDGVTTFALPDLRSRAPVHSGQGNGLSPYALGQRSGSEAITVTIQQMPQHNHTPVGNATTVDQALPTNGVWGNSQQGNYSPVTDVAMAGGAVALAGQSEAHSNVQPYLTVNFVIALTGIFPSRN